MNTTKKFSWVMENFLENKADSRVYRTPECIVLLA